MKAFLNSCLAALCLSWLPFASAEQKGVIHDPDGFTNLRAGQSADADIVARVNAGEVFEFESVEGSEWWKVTLNSGKTGWMHQSRIRFYFTLDEIEEKDEEGSEVGEYAKGRGFDYCKTARAAAQGDPKAMKRYFGINDTDGAAAETHASYFNTVIHLVGDEKLAAFLERQPLDYQVDVRNQMSGYVLYPFEGANYIERHFPKTAKVLCRKEIVAWPSPDGRYAIHKVFSDACATGASEVTRAELIDKASGKVLADLTDDDIGQGFYREGKVMWSPDSKRFAFFSGAPASDAQTVVYQTDGKTFTRADDPEVKFPGRDTDAELKGAKLMWSSIEPLRWAKPDVLIISHHDYLEGKHANGSINSIGRTYEITRNFSTGDVLVKVRTFDE